MTHSRARSLSLAESLSTARRTAYASVWDLTLHANPNEFLPPMAYRRMVSHSYYASAIHSVGQPCVTYLQRSLSKMEMENQISWLLLKANLSLWKAIKWLQSSFRLIVGIFVRIKSFPLFRCFSILITSFISVAVAMGRERAGPDLPNRHVPRHSAGPGLPAVCGQLCGVPHQGEADQR